MRAGRVVDRLMEDHALLSYLLADVTALDAMTAGEIDLGG